MNMIPLLKKSLHCRLLFNRVKKTLGCKLCTFQSGSTKKSFEQSIPKVAVGQPTCFTHPHLVQENKLTPYVSQSEYRERRDEFISRLLLNDTNYRNRDHFIVIPAASKQFISANIPHVFRQNSDFFYLTGCLEPDAILVLVKPDGDDNNYQTILFVHEKDAHDELWEGTKTGCHIAAQLFCVDEARPVQSFMNYFKNVVTKSKSTVVWYMNDSKSLGNIQNLIDMLKRNDSSLILDDPQKILHTMRSVKSQAEIELMKETCKIGCQAMNMAMMATKPGISEQSLNAVLEYAWRTNGAEHGAFPPVMAGGERAATIHYISNNQLLQEGDMVLCDSGSQYWLYNSDISRTWPVSGKFTPAQLILYELVLTTQKRLIELLSEFRPTLDQLFEQMCRLLGKYLQEEGVISKNLSGKELLACAYKICPHHVSHYLGIDVHDTPLITRGISIKQGMVVTVEPGIYIRSDDKSVPQEFRGVGLRIEDDVLINDTSVTVLTNKSPKEVDDVQKIVGTRKDLL